MLQERLKGAVELLSELLPRYARRTRQIDEAILGIYPHGDGKSDKMPHASGTKHVRSAA